MTLLPSKSDPRKDLDTAAHFACPVAPCMRLPGQISATNQEISSGPFLEQVSERGPLTGLARLCTYVQNRGKLLISATHIAALLLWSLLLLILEHGLLVSFLSSITSLWQGRVAEAGDVGQQ